MVTQIFQKYHSRENVVTANTVFFLQRVKSISPEIYYQFIDNLFSEETTENGLQESMFLQDGQNKKGGRSIPDAVILQPSYKIVIETKLYGEFRLEQLKGHLNDFSNEDNKLLLSIDENDMDEKFKSNFQHILNNFNNLSHLGNKISFKHITFRSLIRTISSFSDERDYELNNLINDFHNYCVEDNLINNPKSLMRVPPVGASFNENLQFKLYYNNKLHFKNVAYIGLYTDKSVKAVGKVLKIAIVGYDDNGLNILKVRDPLRPETKVGLNENEKSRIIGAIRSNEKQKRGWNLHTPQAYYLVDKFVKTNFNKISKGGLLGFKYFDLSDYGLVNNSGKCLFKNVDELAAKLSNKTWS